MVIERIDLTPQRGRDLDGRAPGNRRGTVTLDVDVPAGHDAVVLLERDGLYSWHLPLGAAERTRVSNPDREPSPSSSRSSRSVLAVHHRVPARLARPGQVPTGAARDLAHGALQAIVLRFAAPVVVGKVVEHLESGVRTGLVHVTGGTLDAWRPVEALAEVGLPTDRAARVLLLVHGTFSSTTGAFGALAVTPGPRASSTPSCPRTTQSSASTTAP